jgi:hypothetical protein
MKRLIACATACVALAAAAAGTAAAKPPTLHVSGKWTITVRRHGVVTRRVRFENQLQGGGPVAQVLAGKVTPGAWRILSPSSGVTIPATVTLKDDTVFLTGDQTFSAPRTLSDVATQYYACAPSVAPADCQSSGGTFTPFTFRNGVNIGVKAGDSVHFVVRLSFSVPAGIGDASGLLASVLAGEATVGPWVLDVIGDTHEWQELPTTAGWSTSSFTLTTSFVSAQTTDTTLTAFVARMIECDADVAPTSCTATEASAQFPPVFHHTFGPGTVVAAEQQANIVWAVKFS